MLGTIFTYLWLSLEKDRSITRIDHGRMGKRIFNKRKYVTHVKERARKIGIDFVEEDLRKPSPHRKVYLNFIFRYTTLSLSTLCT